MTSGFDHVWLKLDRAKQHIDDLEATIIAFHRTNPYPLVTEDDPQTGKRMVKIGKGPAPIPDAVPLILGDAVHAIRTRLLRQCRCPDPKRPDHVPHRARQTRPQARRTAIPCRRKGKGSLEAAPQGAL